MTKHELWFWLVNAKGMGRKRIQILLEHFKTIEAVYQAKEEELLSIRGIGRQCVEGLTAGKKTFQENFQKLKERKVGFLIKEDKEYPEKLKALPDAPFALYVKGRLPFLEKRCIAIVGARDCSAYGREMAKWFARELSRAGVQVLSGMARGIDGYAHVGAIETGAPTYAVLGCGIDICYPTEHRWIYEEMAKTGGVISEYGMGVQPLAGQFPMRNRIISAMSDGILVVEAKDRSSSLITADYGLDLGKDIFAVPGRIGDVNSYGCNRLIKMGAYLVQKPEDILENYHFYDNTLCREHKKNNYMLETKEKIVYANLSYNPKHVNEIVVDTNLNLNETMESLISLELKGYIKQTMKNFYIVCNDEI